MYLHLPKYHPNVGKVLTWSVWIMEGLGFERLRLLKCLVTSTTVARGSQKLCFNKTFSNTASARDLDGDGASLAKPSQVFVSDINRPLILHMEVVMHQSLWYHIEVSSNGGTPIAGWFIVEHNGLLCQGKSELETMDFPILQLSGAFLDKTTT